MRILAVALVLVAAGCPTPPVAAPPDLSVPVDLAPPICNGTLCTADEYCLVPCLAPPLCYPTEDGGCSSGLLLGNCGIDMALGCYVDPTPRCVKASADCLTMPTCVTCPAKRGCVCF